MDLKRTLPLIGLVALLLVDVVLIALVLRPTSVPAATPTTSSTAAATASRSPTGTSLAGPSSSPSSSPTPLTRLVVPAGEQAVWLADVGACETGGAVHVSAYKGDTWTTRQARGSVTRVRADDARAAFVIGGTTRCETQLWATADGGESWNGPQSAAAAWGRSASDPRRILHPGGDPVTPCEGRSAVLDLAATGNDDASVVCGDGRLRTTADAGATWSTTLRREGLAALALSNSARGVLAALDADCDGVVITVLTKGKVGGERCVEGVDPSPGRVALGVAPSGVWLVVGDAVLRADSPGAGFDKVSDWPAG